MILVWTRPAAADRRAIRESIAIDNPAAALALDQLFSAKAARLAEHPRIGRPGRVATTREWVVHPNYLLIHDLASESVRILRVLHAARRWPEKQ